jgi:flagellar FliL protein
MAEDKKAAKPAGKPLDKGLILAVAFAVINIIVIGGGAYMTFMGTLGFHPPKITEQQLADEKEHGHGAAQEDSGPLLYTMDKFTVNLEGEPRRVIRLEVNLEMLNKDGFEEIINTDNRAKARDRIVQVLNSKTFADLETIQGKLFLKDQIATELNALLHEGVVKDIYFTEFAVQ